MPHAFSGFVNPRCVHCGCVGSTFLPNLPRELLEEVCPVADATPNVAVTEEVVITERVPLVTSDQGLEIQPPLSVGVVGKDG